MPDLFDRHDLVSVRQGGPNPIPWQVPALARAAWEAAGRPLIVRRGSSDGGLPLGLPLPPAMGKARIALVLPPARVSPRPTLGLTTFLRHAPAHWRATLKAAVALAQTHGLRVTPFGALLWEALLGLDYLQPGSDLDLLWRCPGPVPSSFLKDLVGLSDDAPMRLDGEIVVANRGVQWQELADSGPQGRVLYRSRWGTAMCPADFFYTPCPA